MTRAPQSPAATEAERVARASYGRLVALIARQTRDLAAAEDLLSTALLRALETWPRRGVPDNPDAWLLTAARRRGLNLVRDAQAAATRDAAHVLLVPPGDPAAAPAPDPRLSLLFVCAHPAIDPAIRTPLMLQTVLGLDAARIGAAFLVKPAAMAQRLVRAKHRIRDAGIPFRTIEADERAERLPPVLDAIYAAFGQSWGDAGDDLANEAFFLADLVRTALPQEAEAAGLLALMCYVEARRAARRDAAGAFVPLDRQAPDAWSRPLALRAEGLLHGAARRGRPGRYQTEAAIQSQHMRPLWGEAVDRAGIARMHDVLMQLAPSVGATISRAAAYAAAGRDVRRCLAMLDAIPPVQVAGHQPFWATRADLLARAGEVAAARAAYDTAIGLSTDPAVAAFLAQARAGRAFTT